MALKQHSVFYYGHIIDGTNNLIDFKEGAGPIKTATIPVGSYTLTKFCEVVVAALNAASAIDWTFSLNRTSRLITLSASSSASLLFGTGPNYLNTPFALLGLDQVDYLNQTTFAPVYASGNEYAPQFPLQSYKPKEQNKKLANATVTKSATGDTVSVQSFGVERFIKMNVQFITNNPTDGLLRYDSQGVENAVAFMEYVVEKHPIEFMPDENNRDNFTKLYLDSTQQDQNGTVFELVEYYDKNLPGYYETGNMSFKVINAE